MTGALLALYPFALLLFESRWALIAVLAVAGFSALEELLIECRAEGWEPDRKSIWTAGTGREPTA